MIDSASIDNDEGGWMLNVTGEALDGFERISPDALEQLDRSLQPWREWRAEGEAVRREFEAHTRQGLCGNWVPGYGPCYQPAGHDGPCYGGQPRWC